MILRKNKLNPKAKEIQFAICYSSADIKQFLKRYLTQVYQPDNSEAELAFLMNDVVTERDIRNVLEKLDWAFGVYEQPWRSQMSAWAWNRIVEEGYVVKSGISEMHYLFSEKSLSLVKLKRLKQ